MRDGETRRERRGAGGTPVGTVGTALETGGRETGTGPMGEVVVDTRMMRMMMGIETSGDTEIGVRVETTAVAIGIETETGETEEIETRIAAAIECTSRQSTMMIMMSGTIEMRKITTPLSGTPRLPPRWLPQQSPLRVC